MDRSIGRWVFGVTLAGVACVVLAQTPTSGPAAPDPSSQAGAGPEHPWHGHHGGHRGWGPGGPGLLRELRDLGLTQEQHEQIHTIMAGARAQWRKTEGAATGQSSFAALANPGDPNYAAAVQAAKQRATDRIQAMSDVQEQIYNVLTPQQKTALVKVLADQSAHRAQWKESHPSPGSEDGPGGN